MTFQPRTFAQIRDDMINYLKVQTLLTDFEIGSVARSIIEASSLEDDEQYFQMVQLLDAFSLQNAQGSDLDKRVAEFGIVRLQPAGSVSEVVIEDDTLVRSTLRLATLVGGIALPLQSSAAFPTVGFPYTVRVGEGTTAVEDIVVTANTLGTNTLTCNPLVNAHGVGDRVALVTGASDRQIAPSQQVQVPATSLSSPVLFVTTEKGTIVNGNFESTPISVKAVSPGKISNIGVGQISQFTSSPPFNGALVTNKKAAAGGRDLETDPELRDRARNQIQSLSKGTVLALKQAALGVTDAVTGQRVVTANVLEDFLHGEVILYIDDGTGFVPDQVTLARSAFALATVGPVGTIQAVDASTFPAEGFLMLGAETGNIEMVRYTSVNYTTNVFTLAAPTVNSHGIAEEIVLLDVVKDSSDPGATFFNASTFPIARNSQRVWFNSGGGFVLLLEDTDYIIDRGTGQVQLINPLPAGAQLVMTYTYYTGLVATVQKVIDGDNSDIVDFPGVRAAGVVVVVETPIIHRINVRLSISPAPGFTEAALAPQVQETVAAYISGLGIGDDVILASIIERAMLVAGVFNVVVVQPTGDVIVLENELPVPFDANGNSLVVVT